MLDQEARDRAEARVAKEARRREMEENLRAVDAKKRAELEHKKTYRTDDFEKYH